MLILFVRSLILYIVVFAVIRLTGKRQLADLQPFDLVITLLIADLASVPAGDTGVPLLYGIVPILALFLLHQLIAWLSLKSETLRSLVSGRPLIIVAHGKVNERALRHSHYTLTDLMGQLRGKDIFELSTVEYAILETGGTLSVLIKGPCQQPSYADFGLASPGAKPPYLIVQDGDVHYDALAECGYDKEWLKGKLGCDISHVLLAFLNADGTLHVQLKESSGGSLRFIDVREKTA